MKTLIAKARTALDLGLPSLIRVLTYRLGVKLGINPVRRLQSAVPRGDFFTSLAVAQTDDTPPASQRWWHRQDYFGWFQVDSPDIPRWQRNPFTGVDLPDPLRPWWRIPDFDERVGDIKTIWEASRCNWVLTFAQHARQGDPEGLERLNIWLVDWVHNNPPYLGPNWKCGQEASIRVMHLAVAALLLGQHRRPLPALRTLIEAHLRRIAPTIQYAIAQDNNHGTSEAAALFIGGTWLVSLGDSTAARHWAKLGRQWLENRAGRLIAADGSFSQYSVNYHRLMLDTYSLVEHWRRTLKLPSFSPRLSGRLTAATRWLYALTQPETGDAPVLGANDGAWLMALGDTDYRDYRPSVQLAMALFADRRAYGQAAGALDAQSDLGDPEGWNLPLQWLGIPIPAQAAEPPGSAQFDEGGYSLLRQGRAFALLRYPRFRFRPSQADALHVDLWVGGENHLRDAGSYSYNAGDEAIRYFSGTAGHNTVQFDDRDQMPRLSRFLFGDWLRADAVEGVTTTGDAVTAAAAYTDHQGARHHRQVWLSDSALRVEDAVSGFTHKAVLRWRLSPGDWSLDGATLWRQGVATSLRVTASVPIARLELVSGWESRYYLHQEAVPVLEVEFTQPGGLVSEYTFRPTAAHTP